MFKKKVNKIQKPFSDRILDIVTTLILIVVGIVVFYPVWYVVICSISNGTKIATGQILFWPKGINADGYKFVFQYEDVWLGFRNTVFYVVVGTIMSMTTQIICAWPISRTKFRPRHVYTKIIIVTMLVNAGMIPNYMVKVNLGMYGTVWPILLSGLIGSSDLFIIRTCYRSSIPQELYDAAEIDGANEFQCLFKIAVPLAKATISVITLYTIVGHWNQYWNAMIFLGTRKELHPLALVLRRILLSGQTTIGSEEMLSPEMMEIMNNAFEQIKYCLVVVTTIPVLVAYACVQKFFKKGVMIGSVKG